MFSLFILGHIKGALLALHKDILITSQKKQKTTLILGEILLEYFNFKMKNTSHEKDSKHYIMLSIDNKKD